MCRKLFGLIGVVLAVVLAGCQSDKRSGHPRRRNATNGISYGTGRGVVDYSPERRSDTRRERMQHKVTNPTPGLEQPTKLGEFDRDALVSALRGADGGGNAALPPPDVKGGVPQTKGTPSGGVSRSEAKYRDAPPPSR